MRSDLVLSDDNPPGLLVQPLVLPVRVEVGQLGRQSVVFSQPDSVEHSQTGMLVNTRVACQQCNDQWRNIERNIEAADLL